MEPYDMHRTFTLAASVAVFALAVCACTPSPGPAPGTATSPAASPAACTADRLAFDTDRRDGLFDGMSHSGILLVLRNAGTTPCRLPSLPEAVFLDASHQPLRTVAQPDTARAPRAATLLLAPGAAVEAAMRWVSGDVYEHGRCLAPAYLGVVVGGRTLSTAFAGQVCGPGGQPAAYTVRPFQPAGAQR
jgi:hypothetical protein